MSKYVMMPIAVIALLISGFALADSLKIDNAWSPEAPPTARMLAGYMTITNNGADEILIEKVTSPQFGMIEMHRTVQENGMATMKWQPHVHVPAGKVTKLEPGGKHLMLMKPVQRLQAGDQIKLTLHLSNQQSQTVMMTVKKH